MTGHRRTILTMMKDEAADLLEWVAYHRLIGFDGICVYTNDCTDGTDQMLDRMQQMGLVRHFRNVVPDGKKPQPHALTLGQKNSEIRDSDWLLVMDADEFLVIKTGAGHLDDLIAAVRPDTQAIAATWRIMGSNGLVDWNPGLVSASYTRSAPAGFRKGWGVKTLFRPFPHLKLGIHRPTIQQARKDPARMQALLDQLWINGSGRPLPPSFKRAAWRSSAASVGRELVEIHHYAVKSAESYLLRGMRGNVNNKIGKYDATYFAIFDRNEEPCDTLLQHRSAIEGEISAWLEDETLRTLYRTGLAIHAGRIARLRGTPDFQARIAALKRAGAVPYDQLDDILYVQPLPPQSKALVRKMQASGQDDRTIARQIAHSLRALNERRDAEEAAEMAQMERDGPG